MRTSTSIDVFSDDLWLDREYERELELDDFRRSLKDDDYYWGPLPDETKLEIQWDKIELDALDIAERALRSGRPINARKIANKCSARILDDRLELHGGTYDMGDGPVMPAMIINYVESDIRDLMIKGES